jgi:uncharacterized protein YdiU (UPF0061 family)
VDLTVCWQSVGFTHGVLNTDNMSMVAITIDYGPFGFMEAYDSQFVPNYSDKEARYCFNRQLEVCLHLFLTLIQFLLDTFSVISYKFFFIMFTSIVSDLAWL